MILACDLIRIETTSIRPQDEDMLRDGIDELLQFLFALPELFFRILLLNGHSREVSDLSDEVLMLCGRADQVRASRSRRCPILFHRMTILAWTNKPAVHVPLPARAIRTCPIVSSDATSAAITCSLRHAAMAHGPERDSRVCHGSTRYS